MSKISAQFKILQKYIFESENLAHEKNVESVDLVKRFPTHIWSQKSASIQRRTDRSKWGYNIFYSLLNRCAFSGGDSLRSSENPNVRADRSCAQPLPAR